MARRVSRPPFRVLHTATVCQSRYGSRLVDQHLRGQVQACERQALDAHLKRCLPCTLALLNAQTMAAASRYYGTPIGRGLVPVLELVPVVDPAIGRSDLNWSAVLTGLKRTRARRIVPRIKSGGAVCVSAPR